MHEDASSLAILVKINVRPSQVYCLYKSKEYKSDHVDKINTADKIPNLSKWVVEASRDINSFHLWGAQ